MALLKIKIFFSISGSSFDQLINRALFLARILSLIGFVSFALLA